MEGKRNVVSDEAEALALEGETENGGEGRQTGVRDETSGFQAEEPKESGFIEKAPGEAGKGVSGESGDLGGRKVGEEAFGEAGDSGTEKATMTEAEA